MNPALPKGGSSFYGGLRVDDSSFDERKQSWSQALRWSGRPVRSAKIMRQVLNEHSFPFRAIKFLASERSAGKSLDFKGKTYTVEAIRPEAFAGVRHRAVQHARVA